jgi:hypothetical protein
MPLQSLHGSFGATSGIGDPVHCLEVYGGTPRESVACRCIIGYALVARGLRLGTHLRPPHPGTRPGYRRPGFG